MCNLSIFTYYCTNPHCPHQDQPYKQLRIEQVCVPVALRDQRDEHEEKPWIWSSCHVDQCGMCRNETAERELKAKDLVELPSVADCVAFYAKQLGAGIRSTFVAIDSASKASEVQGDGLGLALVGACIYMAAHLVAEPKELEEIAMGLGLGSEDVKQEYRVLWERQEEIVPGDLRCHECVVMGALPEPMAKQHECEKDVDEQMPWWDGLH